MTVRWIEQQPTVIHGVRWLGNAPDFGMLGATPTLVKKWFPERTEAEWNNLDAADQDTLLKQAQTVEAKYNATIAQYKAEGACDATKPGRLAGALRQMLINKGADVNALGPDASEFGISECSAWYALMGSSPTIEDAKQAIYATSLGFNSGTPTYGWMHLTLANFCGSSVKLPTCGAPSNQPLPKAPCSASNPCPSPDAEGVAWECVNGECRPVCGPGYKRDYTTGDCVLQSTQASTGGGGGILGVVLLLGAVLGAIYFGLQAPGVRSDD